MSILSAQYCLHYGFDLIISKNHNDDIINWIFGNMGIVSKIYNLIIILRVLYWHGFLACFLYYFCGSGVEYFVQWISSHTAWAKKTYEYFKVNRHELPGSKPIASGKMMFFANHRSQADFFLHNVIMNHQTSFLSRYLDFYKVWRLAFLFLSSCQQLPLFGSLIVVGMWTQKSRESLI